MTNNVLLLTFEQLIPIFTFSVFCRWAGPRPGLDPPTGYSPVDPALIDTST